MYIFLSSHGKYFLFLVGEVQKERSGLFGQVRLEYVEYSFSIRAPNPCAKKRTARNKLILSAKNVLMGPEGEGPQRNSKHVGCAVPRIFCDVCTHV